MVVVARTFGGLLRTSCGLEQGNQRATNAAAKRENLSFALLHPDARPRPTGIEAPGGRER